MGSFGLIDITGNTFGYSRVIVYGSDGKMKFPTGGGGGTGTVTFIGMTVPSGFSVTPASITTSGTFVITGAGTTSDYIDGTGALQPFPTLPIYTVDNGLTESPANNFQLGGDLIQDTTINGVGNAWKLDFTDLYSSTNTARYLYSFATGHGGNNTLLSLDSLSNISRFSHEDGATTLMSAIELTGTELRVQTPDYATATNGDVLTLLDNTTGEAEWQTPTGGGGGLKSGTAIQAPPGVYTTTITGVTAYTAGDTYTIKFDSVNDGASTLDINGLGAIDIFKNTNVPLSEGDIKTDQEIMVVYDGTNFQAIGLVSTQLLAHVHNAEGAVITKGQVVYAYQASGNKMSVKLARADSDATSAKTIGLVYDSSIGIGGEGYIIIQGVIEGINTAAFSAGDTLYLSGTTFGAATNVKQYAPIHLVYVGIVERANAGQGQIYVRCQNGYELDELHDVQAQTPADKDTLWYDNSVTPKQWKTASIPTILGYTPANAAADLTEISISTANAREDNYTPTGWPGTTDRVKVIRIDSTNTNYMMSLGGLSNPSAGRIVTIYNSSVANNLIIIEHLSTSSTSANRFRMTGNIAYFLLPNRSVTFIYDGTYWAQMSASQSGGFDFFDDAGGGGSTVVAGSSVGLQGAHASGTGAGVRSDGISADDDFGATSLYTGTTATGFSTVSVNVRRAGGNNSFGGYAATSTIPYLVVGKVGLGSLATVAQDYRVHFGMNGTSSLPTNAPGIGYLWVYQGTSSPSFWDVRTQNSGGTTSTVTTALAINASVYVWLGVYKPGGSNTRDAVYFYSTNGVIYTVASKFVGVAGAYGGSPTMVVGSIAGTTAKNGGYDWIGSSFNLAR